MELKKEITNYLKKSVLAQVDRCIDFKNDEFYKISKEEFFNGIIDPNITLNLFKNNKPDEAGEKKEKIDENLYVIIAVKVIRTIEEGSQKKNEEIEDLTGIYFIPAMLNKEKSLLLPSIEDNKLPWFPREFLKPMIEPELAIGDNNIYEQALSNRIYHIYDIFSWEEYLKFCIEIYEETTQCKFSEDYIYNLNANKDKIELESNIYIFPDKTINSTYSIKSLYENILNEEKEMPLYEKFIKLDEEKNEKLQENTIENRKVHLGQMGGEYGLSNSQRESINNFNHLENGEILAIKGPPGTGKTTLIQSIVANEYVKRALQGDLPPLIVAASTNNQAVTNIIESFGKIKKRYEKSNLETRWIEKVHSFATYFPSKSKRKKAKEKNFQYTDSKGNFFVAEIETDENLKKSTEKFIVEAEKIFGKEEAENSITIYKNKIHNRLIEIYKIQNELIDIVNFFENKGIEKVEEYLKLQKEKIEVIRNSKNEIEKRVDFWNSKYRELPAFWKILSFMSKYKTKISNRLKIYLSENEKFEDTILNINNIEEYYSKVIESKNEEIRKIKSDIEKVEEKKAHYEKKLIKLEEYGIAMSKIITDKNEMDEWLDTNIRYMAFWLSVHYYEARWIEKENQLTEKQKGTNYENVIRMYYERLALITPCMVMTFYMLPRQFEVWDGVKSGYLYNEIDLLIVDEAGQVSTEIAAASLSLAKKAVVVGDEYQISPVWGIETALDKSLALQEGVIKNEKEFEILEKYGITASNSNVMKVSCKSCKYEKYGEKGLFLTEHRRCFDDIIKYCNSLVYNGKLNPLRGNKRKDNREDLFPKMGYKNIESLYSQKVGTSRNNVIEAIGIANWLKQNYNEIFEYYKNIDWDNVIGVVTPFKAQAGTIKNVLKQILPQGVWPRITVGTIHTFQGGERKIIIMSTTYGKDEGCFFIDNNKSLMNVAVSRAEDSFLMFGNITCLKDEITSPSGLLKDKIKDNPLLTNELK